MQYVMKIADRTCWYQVSDWTKDDTDWTDSSGNMKFQVGKIPCSGLVPHLFLLKVVSLK